MPSNNDPIPPYEYEIDRSPSMTIIRAIADMENSDPRDSEFVLYDAIDPEALDTLCASDEVRINFEIAQYEVCVVDSNTVQLWP